MKIGLNGTGLVQKASIDAIAEHAQQAASAGFESYWLAEHPTGGFDALTVLAAVGSRVPDINLGTAIIPTFLRHPITLASQALTTNNLIGGRLTLGIGLSHETMMKPLGIDFDKPIRHLKEYLNILMPLLQNGSADFQGDTLSTQATFFPNPQTPTTVLAAALGPQALGVTGRLANGTVLAWTGVKTIREHIAPRLNAAAEAAERPTPQIVASLPVCVTDNASAVREKIAHTLSMYGKLPSYRAMFDREGVDGPGDVAIVGSRTEVEERIAELSDAGVTTFTPTEFGLNRDEFSATRETLVGFLS